MDFDPIKHTLERGVRYPFFPYVDQKLNDWVAINGILADINDRGGLKYTLQKIDDTDRVLLENDLLLVLEDPATATAHNVLRSLTSWGSFNKEWDQVDDDIQTEILVTWGTLILEAQANGAKGANYKDIIQRRFKREVEEALEPPEDTPAYNLEAYKWMIKGAEAVLGVVQGSPGGSDGYLLLPRSTIPDHTPDIGRGVLDFFKDINT